MINLLPIENQKKLAREESWKIIVILGVLILIFFVSFSLILFSVKIYISAKVEAQRILFEEKEKELQSPEMKSLESDMSNFNQKILRLDSFYKKQIKITDSLAKISTVFPSGSCINNLVISIQSNKDGTKQISYNLSGFSSARENLLKIKEGLEKEESFTDVYFPPADWMKATNIEFTASFKSK